MITLRITAKPAYELLLTLVAYLTPGRVDSYEVGPTWFTTVDDRLDDETRSQITRLFSGCEHLVVRLLDVALRLPPPASADDLLAAITELEPRTVRLILLGYHAKRARQRVAPATILAAADGDAAAGRTLIEDNSDGPECERGLAGVLALSEQEAAELLMSVLRSWNDAVFQRHHVETGPLIEREAERLRGRSRELSPEAFVAEAVNGTDVVPAPGVDEIEIFPTWVLRPWNVFCEQDPVLLIGVGVTAGQLSDDPAAPPDRLVRLARAFGDERRLRILRQLLGGSYTLQQLAEQLGTPKTTLLHHLVILRSVGIVQVGTSGQGRYSLRPGTIRELYLLLDDYLPVVPRDNEALPMLVRR
ncbi:hypothetical protein BH23CHL6_BH23CHL6_06830 [soil metagenome]